ncbi:MAG: sodium:solute symporter family protein [Candidatus Krumholzibacteria bacterium]|nr:sodium:solute symporter family protein [Candidatus Krumholzibacteria bacterium]MDP6668430.1 sodium:solute symporter family protein [Candidatus Krumholzibacteria bacterium]MDP6797251.1 sodium:solute symporter family protein [Candidatus Krumholzibacteria bacterium]MDP7021846.1 sodium:solute symporter family protein [Candidatus Krumholzibacteria bacterium]
MTHWVPVAVISVYVTALFAVTWWARKLTARGGGGMVGYLLAGRSLPAGVAAALLAGLAVGGASTIGVAERAYTKGISAGWYNAAWAFGAAVMGLLAARRYRRLEITTLPELFERYYSVAGRVIGVAGQLLLQLVITSLQYVAGGAILSSLMPGVFSFRAGMAVTALVFVGITLIGGFWAAGLTNVINVLVIYGGILLAAILTLGKLGGVSTLASQLPEAHGGFDLLAVGPGLIVAWFLVMLTTTHSTQSIIQIGFAAKNENSARRGFLLGALIIAPVGFISALLGMSAAVLHPGILPAEALPRVVLDLPPLAAGLVLAGLWAADVSTASALLMGSATLVSHDIVKRFFAPDLSGAGEQILSRVTVLALSALTFLLAMTVSGILKMLLIGLTLTTAYTLIVLMTMFWPAVCRKSSATWTLLSTMAALGLWLLAPESWRILPHPIYFTWIVSLLTFFLVTLFDKRRILLR